MNKEEYKEQLLTAWRKVCAWCKENTKGKFPNGKRFSTPHNPYIWVSLVLNDEGDAYIYRGDHSSDKPSYVLTDNEVYGFCHNVELYGDNHHKTDFDANKRYQHPCNVIVDELEMVLRMWPTLKEQILTECRWSDSISDFEA